MLFAQLSKMDRKVKSSRTRALLNRHLASLGVPKSAHCLALRLAEEFAVNAAARSPVPPPEHAPRLTDASRLHVALVTDNVLAAAVAVASAARSAADPARLVLHVLTDRKSYVPMHSWFALHPVPPAVVEVRGLHQLAWRDAGAVASVMRTVEEVRRSSLDWYRRQCGGGSSAEETRPSAFSLLNYLKIHLPEVISDGRIDACMAWPLPTTLLSWTDDVRRLRAAIGLLARSSSSSLSLAGWCFWTTTSWCARTWQGCGSRTSTGTSSARSALTKAAAFASTRPSATT